MIKSWLSKLTNPAVVRAAVLALAISPTNCLANTQAKATFVRPFGAADWFSVDRGIATEVYGGVKLAAPGTFYDQLTPVT